MLVCDRCATWYSAPSARGEMWTGLSTPCWAPSHHWASAMCGSRGTRRAAWYAGAREYSTHARAAANSYRLVKAMRKCLSACAAPSVDAFVSRMLQASPEALLDADMAAVADAYMATPQYQQLRTESVSQVRSMLLAARAGRLATGG